MLTLTAFLAPYLVAFAAFALLVNRSAFPWLVPMGTSVLIVWSPWLIPEASRMLRFLASVSATMLALKVIDVSLDLGKRRVLTWQEYADFLSNPFTLVRRSLASERRPSPKENFRRLLRGSIGCTVALAVLFCLFETDWSNLPFLLEHAGKVTALMLAIDSGLTAAAAIWRIGGGTARDFMDRPFVARTPADFWRRYNRNVQQFFWQDVFGGGRGRRAPIRAMLLVFGLSALLHELVFFAAVGRMQGYQMVFFAVQGLAAASTARVKVRGIFAVPWVAWTMAFNLLTSVIFFASIHNVTPFYSRGLPGWLQGW
jgi:MBOAT, membrane-bound O-acyltransferase family